MTDQTPKGEPLADGAKAKPNPEASPTASESQTSKESEVTLEQLSRRLDQIERGTQSRKDKRISQLQGDVTSLKEVIERFTSLVESGSSADDAIFRMEVENYMKQNPQEAAAVEQEASQANLNQTPSVDPQVTIQAAGLDPADPQVTAILNQGGDPTQALLELASSRKQTPAPDRVVSSGGSPAEATPDLWEQYRAEIAPHRGNVKEVSKIQAKYAKLGLPV